VRGGATRTHTQPSNGSSQKTSKVRAKNKVLMGLGWLFCGCCCCIGSCHSCCRCCCCCCSYCCCCCCCYLLLRILQRKSFVTLFSHFLQIVTGNEEQPDSVAAAFAISAAKMLNKTCRKCATCQ